MQVQKRIRRTKLDIEKSINIAARDLILEKGYQNLTVTSIMKKAKIEPIVFYNRYTDLGEFIDDFVKKYDYWFSDITKDIEVIENSRTQYKAILNNLLNSIRTNKMMQQLLRYELSENNDITQRTARLREFHTLPLVKQYKEIFANSEIEIESISALIIGGIYYLILHGDLSEFAGIDINTTAGLKKIDKAIDLLANYMFSELDPDSSTSIIAKKMKIEGIDEETIVRCTGLSRNLIRQL